MQIAVFIKQVPNTEQLRFDAQNQPAWDSIGKILNPSCGYALEAAVRLKESQPEGTVKISVFSLGKPSAKDVLKRAIAVGCDDAYLLSDDAFKHLDAQTVADVLVHAVRKYVPDAALLLFGQFTDDGMSGITGPAVAQIMDWPCVTLSSQAEIEDEQTVRITRETEDSAETYRMTLPGAVCYANSLYEPRIPSIKGVMRANRTDITSVDAAALGWTPPQNASTALLSSWRKPTKAGGVKIDGSDAQAAAEQTIAFLQAQKVL